MLPNLHNSLMTRMFAVVLVIWLWNSSGVSGEVISDEYDILVPAFGFFEAKTIHTDEL